jgi:outer membrane protein assembly factor BamB
MQVAALLLAGVLLLGALAALHGHAAPQGATARWREVLTIDTRSAHPQKPFEAFDAASLNLYDFNGDGRLEIVSFNDNNRLYVFDAVDGSILSEIQTTHPEGWAARDINPVSIGDLRGDGVPCMVVPNSAAYLGAWCYDAARSHAGHFEFTRQWEIHVDAAQWHKGFADSRPWLKGASPGIDGNAYMADADGDGVKEIFVETDGYPGQLAFNADGSHRWSDTRWDGNGGPRVADLDRDGAKDVVFASDAGIVSCYDAASGKLKWAFDAKKHGANPGSIPVSPLLVDLDRDGRLEVVFGARQAVQTSDPEWREKSHATYFALRHDGSILWRVSHPWMNPLTYNHPAPVDVDGDGALDVVLLDWNTIGHKPGNWEPTDRPANLFALRGLDGEVLWRTGVEVWWSNKDFVVADADGDGRQDVIVPTARGGVDGLGVHDLRAGHAKGWFPLGAALTRGPVAGDLYGQGTLQLVVPIHAEDPTPNYRELDVGHRAGALVILDTGARHDVAFSANLLLSEDRPAANQAPLAPVRLPILATVNGGPPAMQANPATFGGLLAGALVGGALYWAARRR